MQPKLKVTFDDLEHGWVKLRIIHGVKTFTIVASYTPSDSFLELTASLHRLLSYNNETKVNWHCEPLEYEMLFSRNDKKIKLEIHEFSDYRRIQNLGKQVFSISGSYEDICLPFWRALRDLQGRFSTEELNWRWHRQFPSNEIDLLTKEIKQMAS